MNVQPYIAEQTRNYVNLNIIVKNNERKDKKKVKSSNCILIQFFFFIHKVLVDKKKYWQTLECVAGANTKEKSEPHEDATDRHSKQKNKKVNGSKRLAREKKYLRN